MRQKRRMRSTRDRRMRRARQRRGKRLRCGERHQRVPRAGDDEGRRFDFMQRSSQIRGCEQRKRRGERLRRRLAALEQVLTQLPERAPAVVAALHLQRQEAQQRQPIGNPQFVAEPRKRFWSHRARPVAAGHERRRRRDEHQPPRCAAAARAPIAAQFARRATSQAPSTGCQSQPNTSSSASASVATSAPSIGADHPCPGKSTTWTR